jgi:hypothetical protein
MFGLSEQEMDLYRDLTQDFAVRDVAPQIVSKSHFMTPLIKQGEELVPSRAFINQLVTDIETIITITASHMAYDYAHLQTELEMSEEDIIKHLHKKYESYVIQQFIKYGITFTEDTVLEIVGYIILELPYLYVSVIEDEEFDEDEFLEEKLAAYNDYLNENFSDEEEEE